ncbi:hypothetical protein, partial [Blautia intestinihominis]
GKQYWCHGRTLKKGGIPPDFRCSGNLLPSSSQTSQYMCLKHLVNPKTSHTDMVWEVFEYYFW